MITTLAGENSYAVSERLAEIQKQFVKEYGQAGVEVYAAEQLEPQNVTGILGGATLFAVNRLVVIKNVAANKQLAEMLIELLKTVPEEVHLILVEGNFDKRTAFYKALQKETDFQQFTELDEAAAIRWVSELIKKEGGVINAAHARLLVQYIGAEQMRLAHEVAKLLAYDSTISKESIELLVDKNPRDSVFQLLEYALGGETEKALSVLEGLEKAHEDPFQITNMLIWQTHILAVVHSAKEVADSEVAKKAKVNPFVVRKTRSLARAMNKTHLDTILNSVAACDVTLKTTSADPWRVIEQTVLTLR